MDLTQETQRMEESLVESGRDLEALLTGASAQTLHANEFVRIKDCAIAACNTTLQRHMRTYSSPAIRNVARVGRWMAAGIQDAFVSTSVTSPGNTSRWMAAGIQAFSSMKSPANTSTKTPAKQPSRTSSPMKRILPSPQHKSISLSSPAAKSGLSPAGKFSTPSDIPPRDNSTNGHHIGDAKWEAHQGDGDVVWDALVRAASALPELECTKTGAAHTHHYENIHGTGSAIIHGEPRNTGAHAGTSSARLDDPHNTATWRNNNQLQQQLNPVQQHLHTKNQIHTSSTYAHDGSTPATIERTSSLMEKQNSRVDTDRTPSVRGVCTPVSSKECLLAVEASELLLDHIHLSKATTSVLSKRVRVAEALEDIDVNAAGLGLLKGTHFCIPPTHSGADAADSEGETKDDAADGRTNASQTPGSYFSKIKVIYIYIYIYAYIYAYIHMSVCINVCTVFREEK
jgi:hypothetical protein